MEIDLDAFNEYYRSQFLQLGVDTRERFRFIPEQAISWDHDRDIDYLRQAIKAHGKKCLLAFDSNPTIKFDELHSRQYLDQLAEEIGPDIIVLSHDLKHFFEPSDRIYFPHFLVQQRSELNLQQNEKLYRFSFLSNQPRFHRLWLYQQTKKSITQEDCFGVHVDHDRHPDHNFVKSYCLSLLGRDEDLTADLPFFHPHARDSFAENLAMDRGQVDWSNAHPAYSAVFNITGESVCDEDQIFFTEKTWKSIRSRCLTINLGCPDSNYYLRLLGFETGHDVDLSVVDKVKWICDLMSSMTFEQARNIYHDHKAQIEHNYQRFYSKDLMDMFSRYLRDRLGA